MVMVMDFILQDPQEIHIIIVIVRVVLAIKLKMIVGYVKQGQTVFIGI